MGFLRLSSLNSDAAVRVALTGDLDVATVPQLDQALRRAQADAPVVVLDLRGLRFIGACGIELLLATDDRVRQAGGRLVVVRGPSEAKRLFALVAIEGRLEFVDLPPAEPLAAA
jgi:anti-sigma B factor antagonist